jgi:hypothetical protein
MRQIACTFALVAAALTAAPHAAPQDPDLKELAAYRLTKATLDKYRAAMPAIAKALMADPRLQEAARLEAEREKLEMKDELTAADAARIEQIDARLEAIEQATELPFSEGSLSEIEAGIRARPALAAALQANGLAPREFATFTLVLFQASRVVGLEKAGLLKELPKEIARENVEFVRQHEAELAQMQKELEARAPGDKR